MIACSDAVDGGRTDSHLRVIMISMIGVWLHWQFSVALGVINMTTSDHYRAPGVKDILGWSYTWVLVVGICITVVVVSMKHARSLLW